MTTFQAKKDTSEHNWYIIDLKGQVLGRAATLISNVLRGKNKPQYTPHTDAGDFVIALNASQVKLTGKKLTDKHYYWHSGYPGGISTMTAGKLLERNAEEVIKKAVKGMLPKNILADHLLKKLKVYPGEEHPHQAQQPKELKI